jgi:hypothetical protein
MQVMRIWASGHVGQPLCLQVKGRWAQALLNLSFPQIRETVLLLLSCRCNDKGLSPCSGSDPCALVHAGTMGRLLTTACG